MFRTAAAALFTIFTLSAAQAGTVAVHVPYGDLDLATGRDAAILTARAQAAAEKACGPVYTPDGRATAIYQAMTAHDTCVKAVSGAVLAKVQAQFPKLARQ